MQYQHFSIEEREQIQYGLWEQRSVRGIARELGRSPFLNDREKVQLRDSISGGANLTGT